MELYNNILLVKQLLESNKIVSSSSSRRHNQLWHHIVWWSMLIFYVFDCQFLTFSGDFFFLKLKEASWILRQFCVVYSMFYVVICVLCTIYQLLQHERCKFVMQEGSKEINNPCRHVTHYIWLSTWILSLIMHALSFFFIISIYIPPHKQYVHRNQSRRRI